MTNHPYTLEESARLAQIEADRRREKRENIRNLALIFLADAAFIIGVFGAVILHTS